jgi:tetratricopeptide (TPR) repeat protein
MIYKKIFLPVFLCFGIITAIQAGNFNSLYRTGLRKLNARDYEAALNDFKKAFNSAELSQDEVKILFAIADVYARQKKYKAAKNWIMRILDIPDSKLNDKISVYHRMAAYSISLKRYDDALDDIKTALKIVKENKDKVFFLMERAGIFELQKDYQGAVDTLQECIKICERASLPRQRAQQRLIVVLYEQKKYAQILKLMPELQTAKWEASSQEIVYYYAGLSAMQQKKYEQAVSWFEHISDDGHSWLVYSKNSQLGNCWKNLLKYEKAYTCFEIIYKNVKLQNYYRAKGLEMMAEMCYLQKKYKDAKKLCEELKKFPGASKIQLKQADMLLAQMKSENL